MATTKIPAEFLSTNAIQGTLIADNAITTVHIAQNAITSVQIPNNSIGTVQIALNTVTGVHIAQNSVTTVQLATNSVNTLNIADDQVTADKLASEAVVTASIVDLNVTEAKIAANAITASKIPDGSITATQIGANAVTLAKMASLARGSILIGNSAADVTALGIGTSGYVLKSDGTDLAWAAEQAIAANSVTSGMIASNSILTRHIDDDQVTGDQLADTITVVTSVVTPLVDAAIVDGENFKVNGGQGSDGQVLTSTGSGVAWEASSGTTINNNADNRVITGSGTANTLEGEAGMTFDGSTLDITGSGNTTLELNTGNNSGDNSRIFFGDSASDTAGFINYDHQNNIMQFASNGAEKMRTNGNNLFLNGGTDARIQLGTGGAGANQVSNNTVHIRGDGADMKFMAASGGIYQFEQNGTERLRISSSGDVQLMGGNQMTNALAWYNTSSYELASIENVSHSSYNDSGGLLFKTAGLSNSGMAERMRIDSSGNVGIGNANPQSLVHIKNNGNGGTEPLLITNSQNGNKLAYFYESSAGDGYHGMLYLQNGSGTTKAKISTNGASYILDSFHIGKTDTSHSTLGHVFNSSGTYTQIHTVTNNEANILNNYNASGTDKVFDFRWNNSSKGSVALTSSAVAFNTSSDYRLKENVDYTWDATTRLKQLKPARFNWISDSTDTTVDGFLAHEVSSVVPNAVTGTKDEVYAVGHDLAGNDLYQSVDHSKLVPLLVKTIQELEARLTAGGL